MQLTRRDTLLAMAAIPALGAGPRPVAAFHYAAIFSPREVEWYTRFEILVTGGILSREQTQALRRNGVKLVAYEWSSGYYAGDPVSAPLEWQRMVDRHAADWAITAKPVSGGAAENGKPAQWYDFASDELNEARARHLATRLADSGYDGYFFDTPGFEQLPPSAREAFHRKHPGADYNQRQGRFFAAVRKAIGAPRILFLNQGFRQAEHFLPHADLDLSESYCTYLDPQHRTGFRPWHDAAKPWESVRTPIRELIEPALARFPRVRMVHANYSGGEPALAGRAHRYGWACARLFGHDAYLIAPGQAEAERDAIYFTDPGKPLSAAKEEPGGSVAWRRFQNGVVAVNGGAASARIAELGLTLPEGYQGYFFPSRS
ncbi:MAG: hypothetical protein U0Q16_26990 [Bryobacteraceae bacterium]